MFTPLSLLLIGTIIILILIAVGVYISSNSERTLVEDRLGRYLDDEEVKTVEAEKRKAAQAAGGAAKAGADSGAAP